MRLKRCRHRARSDGQTDDPAAIGSPSPGPCPTNLARALLGELQGALGFYALWVADGFGRLRQRPSEYWFSLLTLIIATVGIFGTWYAALQSAPSAAQVRFDTGVLEEGGGGGTRSFATPKLHETLPLRLTLTPMHEDLTGVSITISPPRSVRLTDGCYYKLTRLKERRNCLKPNGEGRVDVARLGAGETLEVAAEAEVVHRIDGQEVIAIEMSSADDTDSSRKQIDLYPPKGSDGEEAAKESFEEELEGPLHWVESTLQMPDDVFEDLGDQWAFLSPRRLHGLEQVPYGRLVNVRSLVNNRLLGSKIVTFKSVVESPPLRVKGLRARPSNLRMFKELLSLSSTVPKRDLWCMTSRSSAQPRLHPGDPVLVRAALIGWGLARPFGQEVQTAMAICPVVHLLDREVAPGAASASGGVAAPPG
jgi:hypothetical protein